MSNDHAQADPLRRYQLAVATAVVGFTLVRLFLAALLPLTSDEALYWRWSQHLSGGYLDHPPMNPLLIRIGTTLFGDTEFGVRVITVLLGVPATWAVWRTAAILFRDGKVGATAALYFNLTLAMACGSLLATPDFAVMVAACFLLFFLAKLVDTEHGAWWLAVGAAFGLGMFSKYSMLFFAVGIFVWVCVVPELRRWLVSPWPWAGAVVALVFFSPVLIWNARHGWASFLFQANRLVVHEWSLRYVGEFFASQIGLATPSIFLLGCMALVGLLRFRTEFYVARALVSAMVWPIVVYFVWHTFHGRVEGNWPEPAYPAFTIAAALAAERLPWQGIAQKWVDWSKRLAVPVALGITAFIYLQALFAIIPLGRIDPTARQLGAGWPVLASQIDDIRKNLGAGIVLTKNYGLAAWLAFYMPSHPPVEQMNLRIRWVDAPPPDPALFRGPMLFVCGDNCWGEEWMRKSFNTFARVAELKRQRRGVTIEHFIIYRVADPIGPVLEQP